MFQFLVAVLALELPLPIACLLLAWLFMVGGCIGSFMNVVIYRLPAGLSLLHPASRCPKCETPIRATDNVPIFGWLWLRGRCRNCRAPISVRYPAVELLVALLFVVLAWVEPLSGGSNLPSPSGIPTPELWGIYAYHLFLLCSLICAAFTELDGHRLTPRLVLPGLVIGLVAPLVWPHLRAAEPLTAFPSSVALLDGLIGTAVGGLVGYAISLVALTIKGRVAATPTAGRRMQQQPHLPPVDVSSVLAWVGAFLGWQAAITLALLTAATLSLCSSISRFIPALRRLGLVSHLALWTLTWIILRRQIHVLLP